MVRIPILSPLGSQGPVVYSVPNTLTLRAALSCGCFPRALPRWALLCCLLAAPVTAPAGLGAGVGGLGLLEACLLAVLPVARPSPQRPGIPRTFPTVHPSWGHRPPGVTVPITSQ